MDEIIERDQNHVTVGTGVSDDSDQDILMLRVDPITKYLLVEITADSEIPVVASQIAKRDQNHVPVCLAWNEDDQELQEVLMDSNGNILCDVVAV